MNYDENKVFFIFRTLIIDEISMVDGNLFQKVEEVARIVRKDQRPFGGIQLILCVFVLANFNF